MFNIANFRCVALLVDADNIPLHALKQILKLSRFYGELKYCRAYGDWKQPPLSSFHDKVRDLKIEIQQVDRIAKDTSDKQLMIEAVEILVAGKVDTFIIASGDGDFRLLCKHIKEKGRQVICIGNKNHSSSHLQEACNTSHYIEDVLADLIPKGVEAFRALCFTALDAIAGDQAGWVSFDELSRKLRELDSNFKIHFGHKRLSTWVNELSDQLEVQGQKVRKIMPRTEPDVFDRLVLLREAYLQSKLDDGRANIGQIGNVLRKLDNQFESHFGGKKLVDWLKEYPDTFVQDKDHVSMLPVEKVAE